MVKEVNVVMPKLGMTMKEGLIVEWKKKEGDKVEKDEAIAVVESEKITAEVKSPEAGVLKKIVHKEGEEVNVGETIAIIERE